MKRLLNRLPSDSMLREDKDFGTPTGSYTEVIHDSRFGRDPVTPAEEMLDKELIKAQQLWTTTCDKHPPINIPSTNLRPNLPLGEFRGVGGYSGGIVTKDGGIIYVHGKRPGKSLTPDEKLSREAFKSFVKANWLKRCETGHGDLQDTVVLPLAMSGGTAQAATAVGGPSTGE
jgi:hypothetical protein